MESERFNNSPKTRGDLRMKMSKEEIMALLRCDHIDSTKEPIIWIPQSLLDSYNKLVFRATYNALTKEWIDVDSSSVPGESPLTQEIIEDFMVEHLFKEGLIPTSTAVTLRGYKED